MNVTLFNLYARNANVCLKNAIMRASLSLGDVHDSQSSHPVDDQATHPKTFGPIPSSRLRIVMLPNAVILNHLDPLIHNNGNIASAVSYNRQYEYFAPCF